MAQRDVSIVEYCDILISRVFCAQPTIDLILTNSHHVSESGTIDHLISDHLSIFAIRKKYRRATWLALRHPEDSDDFVLM